MNTDALGFPIKIGQRYGQSSRASGSCVVLVGKAVSCEDGNVRLEEVIRGRASFNETIHDTPIKRKIVTVSSNSVFPVNEFVIWKIIGS